MARHEREAAHEVLKLATAVTSRKVAETVLALFLMEELEQRRFKSDRAFRTQLVRRVRGLTDLNAGMWFDHRNGKTKRAYRDLPPRAATMMARWLTEVFGMAGLQVARLEQAETDRRQSERQALHEAASRLT